MSMITYILHTNNVGKKIYFKSSWELFDYFANSNVYTVTHGSNIFFGLKDNDNMLIYNDFRIWLSTCKPLDNIMTFKLSYDPWKIISYRKITSKTLALYVLNYKPFCHERYTARIKQIICNKLKYSDEFYESYVRALIFRRRSSMIEKEVLKHLYFLHKEDFIDIFFTKDPIWDGKLNNFPVLFLQNRTLCTRYIILNKRWDGDCQYLSRKLLSDRSFCTDIIDSSIWNGDPSMFNPDLLDNIEFCRMIINSCSWNGSCENFGMSVIRDIDFVQEIISSKKWNGLFLLNDVIKAARSPARSYLQIKPY